MAYASSRFIRYRQMFVEPTVVFDTVSLLGAKLAPISDHVIHYNDVIMGAIASQITSLTIVYSAVYLDADHRKHQSSELLAFVRRIHRWPVNSPHKWLVTRKMYPFDDVIMYCWLNIQVHINGILLTIFYCYFLWFHYLHTMRCCAICHKLIPQDLGSQIVE